MVSEEYITMAQATRCSEVAQQFTQDPVLWPEYVQVVKSIEGIDFDLHISSEPCSSYIFFVGNTVRTWLRLNAPDIEEQSILIGCFHEHIFRMAEAKGMAVSPQPDWDR